MRCQLQLLAKRHPPALGRPSQNLLDRPIDRNMRAGFSANGVGVACSQGEMKIAADMVILV
jgi:hypothetical protein